MKKLLVSAISSVLLFSSASHASELNFTVKLKDNVNINSFNIDSIKLQSIAKLEKIEKQNAHYVFVFKSDDSNITSLSANDCDKVAQNDFHKAMEITRQLQKDGSIEYAVYRGVKMKAFGLNSPNLDVTYNTATGEGSRWDDQWDMHGDYSVHADDAWNIISSKDLSDVTVAITDTGIAPYAPSDINGRVIRGLYFYQNGANPVTFKMDPTDHGSYHGTHVAGTIGAIGPVVRGVTATADSVKLVAVKVLGDNGSGSFDAVDAGVEWAVGAEPGYDLIPDYAPENPNPAQVVNLSLGAQKLPWTSQEDWDTFAVEYCKAWQYVVDAAHSHNSTLVIAAGNGNLFGQPTDVSESLPAGCTNGDSLVVSATGPKGEMAFYSNTTNDKKTIGNNFAVKAPGGNDSSGNNPAAKILSTVNNGYGYMQGTSMATPHVAGVAALVFAVNGGISYEDVQMKVQKSTTDSIVDASKAVS